MLLVLGGFYIRLVAVAVCLIVPCAIQAQNYDAAAQFDPNANPASVGNWSYGYTTTLGGVFTLFTHKSSDGSFTGWDLLPSDYPDVVENLTGGDLNLGGNGFVPREGLTQGAGISGEYSVVRWTAPVAHSYSLTTIFTGVYNNANGTNADIHIFHNGDHLFDGTILHQSSALYQTSLNINSGDTIDYVFGRGSDGTASFDRVILDAHISTVPEIGLTSAMLTGSACFGTGLLLCRRRK